MDQHHVVRDLKRTIRNRVSGPWHAGRRTAQRMSLAARGWAQNLIRSRPLLDNVYHACIQKSGSQWIKSVFQDPRIVEYTGLRCYPQQRYEWGEFKRRFPKGVFVPGLYIPYGLYDEIEKTDRYRTFYVVRDPRDIAVSWYYSMLYTHDPVGKVPMYRHKLEQLDASDGLAYCIRALHLKFAFMRSWWANRSDPAVLLIRFEELTQHPSRVFDRVLTHCGYQIPVAVVDQVLADYTKDKMRQRDLERRNDERSHYRAHSKGWREAFTERHITLFKHENGNLAEALGYEW